MDIREQISQMGFLAGTSTAILDYVTATSELSKSELVLRGQEWTLKPDNWINIRLVYTRKKAIHISLGVYPSTLDAQVGLRIKQGRFPNWSKITIGSVLDLPPAFYYIETAYFASDNAFRSQHGKPTRDALRQLGTPRSIDYSQL